jgi:hypothetical protein
MDFRASDGFHQDDMTSCMEVLLCFKAKAFGHFGGIICAVPLFFRARRIPAEQAMNHAGAGGTLTLAPERPAHSVANRRESSKRWMNGCNSE